MKKALLAAAILASSAALAEPHSYTYIEGGWFDRSAEWDLEIPGVDNTVEGDGYSVAGSFHTDTGLLVRARYSEGDIDSAWGIKPSDVDGNMDVESYGFLIGGASQSSPKTSIWAGFGYDRDELTATVSGLGSADYEVDHFSLAVGARHSLIPMIEINGGGRLVHSRADETDLLDKYSDTDVELSVGARFQPIKMLSIGANYAHFLDADSELITADIRLQF